MAGGWKIAPPLSNDQLPSASFGSFVKKEFEIIKHSSDFEILICLHWTGLPRQEVSNLRNLTNSAELENLTSFYGYGISTGTRINLMFEKDPNDAEFDLMISSEKEISQESIDNIVEFVKCYRVR